MRNFDVLLCPWVGGWCVDAYLSKWNPLLVPRAAFTSNIQAVLLVLSAMNPTPTLSINDIYFPLRAQSLAICK